MLERDELGLLPFPFFLRLECVLRPRGRASAQDDFSFPISSLPKPSDLIKLYASSLAKSSLRRSASGLEVSQSVLLRGARAILRFRCFFAPAYRPSSEDGAERGNNTISLSLLARSSEISENSGVGSTSGFPGSLGSTSSGTSSNGNGGMGGTGRAGGAMGGGSNGSGTMVAAIAVPSVVRRVMASLHREVKYRLAQQILSALRAQVPIRPATLDIVQHYLNSIPPPLVITDVVRLHFVDMMAGAKLFPSELQKRLPTNIVPLTDASFLYVEPDPTDDEAVRLGARSCELLQSELASGCVSFRVPYWLMLTVRRDNVVLRVQAPNTLTRDVEDLLSRLKALLRQIARRVNQLLLLEQMFVTKVMNPLLSLTDPPSASGSEPTGSSPSSLVSSPTSAMAVAKKTTPRLSGGLPVIQGSSERDGDGATRTGLYGHPHSSPHSIHSDRPGAGFRDVFAISSYTPADTAGTTSPSSSHRSSESEREGGLFSVDDLRSGDSESDVPYLDRPPRRDRERDRDRMRGLERERDRRKVFRAGEFACPLVHRMILPLHERLGPDAALKIISGKALHYFALSRPNYFAYREREGHVFYFRLYYQSSPPPIPSGLAHPSSYRIDFAHITSPPTSSPHTPPDSLLSSSAPASSDVLPVFSLPQPDRARALSLTNSSSSLTHTLSASSSESSSVSSGSDPQSSVDGSVLTPHLTVPGVRALTASTGPVLVLDVYGLSSPGTEITHDLFELLEHKLEESLVQLLGTLLLRNPLLKLTHADVDFLQPPPYTLRPSALTGGSTGPRYMELVWRLPTGVIHNSQHFLLYLRATLTADSFQALSTANPQHGLPHSLTSFFSPSLTSQVPCLFSITTSKPVLAPLPSCNRVLPRRQGWAAMSQV